MSKHPNITPDLQKAYDSLLATVPEIERKGKNNPYTSLNGHMFSFIAKEGYLAIRLPKDKQEQFFKHYSAEPAISYGAVMREYVRVPDSMIHNTDLLSEYLKISLEYIKTLKPKPSKKKS